MATSNPYQRSLGLNKIVENFEVEVAEGNLEQGN